MKLRDSLTAMVSRCRTIRMNYSALGLLLTTVVLIIILAFLNLLTKEKKELEVLIYAATKFFGDDMASTRGAFVEVCPRDIQDYCRISSNQNDFKKANAVIYHRPDFIPQISIFTFNTSKIHVMLSLESPHFYDVHFQPGLINWTMTYRPDSDVPFPYAILKPREKGYKTDFEQIWAEKNDSLTAAWMATSCVTPNNRIKLVQSAQNAGLGIDVFGRCGRKLVGCDRYAENRYECAASTLKAYKFYMALENTNCHAYVTEKFFNSFRLYKAVPIVIRRSYYEEIGIPGDSFIAIDDFKSMKDLVKHIDEIKNDKAKYLKYHAWRDQYQVQEYSRHTGFCRLCQKLKHTTENTESKYIPDPSEWFDKDACDNNYADKYMI